MNSQHEILLRKFLQIKAFVSFLSSVELFGLTTSERKCGHVSGLGWKEKELVVFLVAFREI